MHAIRQVCSSVNAHETVKRSELVTRVNLKHINKITGHLGVSYKFSI
jgi:hypothetical protein